MKFRQKPTFGYVMIVIALALLTLGALTTDTILLLLGAMNGFIGVSMLARDIVEISTAEIRIKNLLGMTLRRIPYAGIHQLSIQDGMVYLDQGDTSKPIKALNQRSIRKEDWQRLEHKIGIRELGNDE